MRFSLRSVREFLIRDDGPTAVEYAVMLALIVAACTAGIQALGGNAEATYNSASGAFSNVGNRFVPAKGSLTSPDGTINYNPSTGEVTNAQTGQPIENVDGTKREDRRLGRELQREGWTVNP